jgi:hypothetical protein
LAELFATFPTLERFFSRVGPEMNLQTSS